jgi:hypothetical protein
MKIGILTHWWSDDNYGQQLQCYALQKYLRNAGHEPFLIRYIPRDEKKKGSLIFRVSKVISNPTKTFQFIKNKTKRLFVDKKQKSNNIARNFEGFRTEYIMPSNIIYHSYNELKENPPLAGAYIVGSDQVWGHNARDISNGLNKPNTWFLNFGSKKTLKIAYAASWGAKEIPEQQAEAISPLLKKFFFVGVRELSGISICKQCGFEKSSWTPDPTLLFEAKDYYPLFNNIKIIITKVLLFFP